METNEKLAAKITEDWADRGCLVEGGFRAMILTIGILDPQKQPLTPREVVQLRYAFFSGAQHLFASLMNLTNLGLGSEPTSGDLRRLDLIDQELRAWVEKDGLGKGL